jgi:hypothetical protein
VSAALFIRCVGMSHLLQPPLTLLLSRRLGLARAFRRLEPLPAMVAHNMAVASVLLPTSAGLIVALAAEDVAAGGPIRELAWLLAAFWTWRLARQALLRPHVPRGWHWGLSAIFVAQGPAFGALLLWSEMR